MRNRKHHRSKHGVKGWLQWLKSLWKSIVRSIRAFFTENVDKDRLERSPRSFTDNDEGSDRVQEKLHKSNLTNSISRPQPFLLGLEDIHDLESLTTKDLIDRIEWNAEGQEVLTAKEEDLTLLEDLLISFPDS